MNEVINFCRKNVIQFKTGFLTKGSVYGDWDFYTGRKKREEDVLCSLTFSYNGVEWVANEDGIFQDLTNKAINLL